MKLHIWLTFSLLVTIAGCAAPDKNPGSNNLGRSDNLSEEITDEDFDLLAEQLDEQKVEIADPLEFFNRFFFGVNDALYFWVAKPVAETYEGLIPKPARIGIRNFFNNLTTPVRYVNCLLQGKGDAAGTELDRFLINTTEGILGFGDPALDKHGIKPVEEDLGQTLAVHGFEDGFYLVLPLLGPTTLRDGIGKVGDLFLNPVFYVDPTEAAIGISVGRYVNEGSFYIGEYETFKAAAVDPYIAMRQAYIQYRKKQIRQ
jgi:phospholipid-binding lipoprotein MlaA